MRSGCRRKFLAATRQSARPIVEMHEFAVTQSLVEIALDAAQQSGAQRLTAVHVVVGNLTGIVEDSMRFYYEALVQGTPAEGAVLHVELRTAVATCRRCGRHHAVAPPLDPFCPECGAAELSVEGGHELLVDRIEIETNSETNLESNSHPSP